MLERVARFIEDPGSEPFERLAADACRDQLGHVTPWAELCDRRGIGPAELEDWRRAPLVEPRDHEAAGFAAVWNHPHPELHRAALAASLPRACFAGIGRPPILSLIPNRDEAPSSDLALMADQVLRRFGAEESAAATGPGAVQARITRSWLAARQRARQPALILATTSGIAALLDSLDRLDLRFRLPAGSRLLESVGGHEPGAATDRGALSTRLTDRLGLGPESVVRELGSPGVTSRLYTMALTGGDPEVFVPPPWARARILDPKTLEEAAAGAVGRVSIFDLASFGSALHLLTEHLGLGEGPGFRRIGGVRS